MDKRKIFFRTDGGTSIGMGHVSRCIALAGMLKKNFNISFAVQETSESTYKTIQSVTDQIIILPETNNYTEDALNFSKYLTDENFVVLDGYNFKTDYQEKIKEKKCKLVCIDDLHDWHFVADAIINHAEGIDKSAYSGENYTKFYLGVNYVLLRKPFLEITSAQRRITDVKKIFISMGAADVNNLTQKFAEALLLIKGIEEINLLLGSINPNLKSIENSIRENSNIKIIKHFDLSAEELKQLLQTCDVAICPASTISLECCSVGIGLISGFTSQNQMGILNGLKKYNAAIDLGNMNTLVVEEIKNKIEKIIKQTEIINEVIKNQEKIIDGKSPGRLIKIFEALSDEKLYFRFAEERDADLYFHWANDPLVRKNSYNKNAVLLNDHIKWFRSKLISEDCKLYLFFNQEDKPMGQVRIEKSGNETVIGISVDKMFRGKSYGVKMLDASTRDYLSKNTDATIVAYIKIENIGSRKIFLEAGFDKEEIISVKGNKSYKLHKALN